MHTLESLYEAILSDDLQSVQYELNQCFLNKTNINQCLSDETYPPLHEATLIRNAEIVKAILDYPQCDPNLKSKNGYTALHLAAKKGCEEIITMLLEHGADPHQTRDGITPYHLAQWHNKKNVLKLLPPTKNQYRWTTQEWIRRRLVAFGLMDNDGYCFALAHVVMFAALNEERNNNGNLRQISILNRHLRHLRFISSEQVRNDVRTAELKRKYAITLVKDFVKDLSAENKLFCYQHCGINHNLPIKVADKELIEILINSLMMDTLTKDELIDLETPVFLQALSLLQEQSQNLYQHLRSKEKKNLNLREKKFWCLNLLLPLSLEQEGGLFNLDYSSGVYFDTELNRFFEILHHYFKKYLHHPISLLLHGSDHVIEINYDPLKDIWYFADINLMSKNKEILRVRTNELAGYVSSAAGFAKNKYCMFLTEFFVTKSNVAEAKNMIAALQKDSIWKSLHTVTATKIKVKNEFGSSWFYLAKHGGEIDRVREIMRVEGFLHRNWRPLLGLSLLGLTYAAYALFLLIAGIFALPAFIAFTLGGVTILAAPIIAKASDSAHISEVVKQDTKNKYSNLQEESTIQSCKESTSKPKLLRRHLFQFFSQKIKEKQNPSLVLPIQNTLVL